MTITFADLCSAGGGATCGARMAGLTPVWAVECHRPDADVYRLNHGDHVITARVEEVDYASMERPDFAWASPSCRPFSAANPNGVEGPNELACADGVCAFLIALTPKVFLLENVRAYQKSESLNRIRKTLSALDYWWTEDIIDCADYGVPQNRIRLILRAVLHGSAPPLPSPKPWRGWLSSIEHLIPDLPETTWAKWQIPKLPMWLRESTLFPSSGYDGQLETRTAGEPAPTITTVHTPKQMRAFIVDGKQTRTTNDEPATLRFEDEPTFTVTADGGRSRHRLFLPGETSAQGSLFDSFLMGVNGEHGDGIRYAHEPAPTIAAGHSAGKMRAFLVDGQNAGGDKAITIREDNQPAVTVCAGNKGYPRALLVGDQYGSPQDGTERRLLTRTEDEPSMTVRAGESGGANPRAWMECGVVKSMNARALACFQSFPEWYKLPAAAGHAARIVGNAAPPLMVQAIIEGMKDAL